MPDPVPFKSAADGHREQAVAVLRKLLAACEGGEVVSVAVAYTTRLGAIGGDFSEGSAGGMLGAVSLLQHRLLVACEQS